MSEGPHEAFGGAPDAGRLDRPPPRAGQEGHSIGGEQDRTRMAPPERGRVIGSVSVPMPRTGGPGPPPHAGGARRPPAWDPQGPPPPAWDPQAPPPQWAPPGAPPGRGGSRQGPPGPPPNNHMAFAILATVLCCLPLGIVGIVKASEVNNKWAVGDYAGARGAAESARKFSMWGMILGGGVIALVVVAYVVIAAVAVGNGY